MKTVFVLNTFFFTSFLSLAQSWLPLKEQMPANVNITGLYASKTSSSLVASTFGSGIYRQAAASKDWQQVASISAPLFCLSAWNDKVLFAGSKGAIYRSLDSGKTWIRHAIGSVHAVGHIAFHPSGRLVAGTGSLWDPNGEPKGDGVWISTDTGKTWVQKNTGIAKADPLIQSLAVASNGTILIGLNERNSILKPKYGVMMSTDIGESWQRLPLNIKAPFHTDYQDANVWVSSVFNLTVTKGGHVLASIAGIYSNFAIGFTIKKEVSKLNDPSTAWKPVWTKDSILLDGGYYHQLISYFEDSEGKEWGSVCPGSNEIRNVIISGSLSKQEAWKYNGDGVGERFGRFLFSEEGQGHLYSVDYFSGDSVFVIPVKGIVTALPEKKEGANLLSVYPNPFSTHLYVKGLKVGAKNFEFQLVNAFGQTVFVGNKAASEEVLVLKVENQDLKKGVYYLRIQENETFSTHKVAVEYEDNKRLLLSRNSYGMLFYALEYKTYCSLLNRSLC